MKLAPPVALLVLLLAAPVQAGPSQSSGTVPLPASRTAKTATPAGKPCHVGGFTGVTLPGSSLCMKLGGFVRVDAASGGGGQRP